MTIDIKEHRRQIVEFQEQVERLIAERDRYRREAEAWRPRTLVACPTCQRGIQPGTPCEWCEMVADRDRWKAEAQRLARHVASGRGHCATTESPPIDGPIPQPKIKGEAP